MDALSKGKLFNKVLPFLLVAPIVVWLVITIIVPLFSVVKESFYSTGFVGTKGAFVGFDNYRNTILSSTYWNAWGKSLVWVLGNALLQSILAFGIALLLNRKTRFNEFARTWMIIPWVIPTIVVVIMWQWILNGSYGIFNHLLQTLHLIDKPVNLIGHSFWSMPMVIFINTWHWFPFMAVIILAGMSTINEEIYEAADIDGVNKWQKFWKITFPSLGKVTFALGLVGTLWSFNIFDTIYFLTQGGPAGKTTTIPVLIYQQAFESYRLGQASATSIVTALILIVYAYFFIKFLGPKDE